MDQLYLLWEMIPEGSRIYNLAGLSVADFERIKRCHGHYINLCGTPEDIVSDLTWLDKFLLDQSCAIVYDSDVGGHTPIEISDGVLVVCGWVL